MKVISGTLKGRKIEGYNLDKTRPTMDRVKESLFGMIQDYVKESVCLDLFAGTGNLGIEAISNGAKMCYFIDKDNKAYNTIKSNINNFNINDKSNINNFNINDKSKIINRDYNVFLKNIDIKFDIIFLDPPYKTNYIEESLLLIDKYNLLSDDGIIVCESDDADRIVYSNKYTSIKDKRYGDKYIVILKKRI